MRTTCSRAETNTLPSPIFPVRAEFSIASITRSTMASSTAASIFTLGRKSTTYSAPRYSSVWPFWRPKPLTSVTVIPWTPMPLRASRTSSSLNGFTMAVTIFISVLLRRPVSEGLADRQHDRVVRDVALRVRRGAERHVAVRRDVGGAQDPAAGVVGDAQLPVGDAVARLRAADLRDAGAVLQVALEPDV